MKDNLEDYTWGLGIEHEMHIFHKPKETDNNIEDFILFDSESAVLRLIQGKERGTIKMSDKDYKLLKDIPFELSGRVCNKVVVLERVPIKMPELITWLPFCSVKKNRSIINMINDMQLLKKKFFNILKKDKLTNKLIKKYGDLTTYPSGMTRYLKYSEINDKPYYKFKKESKTNKDKVHTDYTGSYHITMTLPYTNKTSEEKFIEMHQNFANQLQWLEPLLLIGFFSNDEYCPGSIKRRARGSYRVMVVGWGNLAGSDVRLFKKGLGRYAKTETYWRNNFKMEGIEKLKACYKPSPKALNEGGTTSLSTDFRTFGDNENNERVSGYPMKKPNGIEFRIFDHFDDHYLESLMMFITLVAENSRNHTTKKYVYKNDIWIKEVHNIMLNGYRAEISKSYVNLLEKELNIKIKKDSLYGYNIFKEVFHSLFKKNRNGLWFNLMTDNVLGIKGNQHKYAKNLYVDYLVNASSFNKSSWDLAFTIKINRNKNLYDAYLLFLNVLKNIKNDLSIKEFQFLIEIMLGKSWKKEYLNILLYINKYVKIDYDNENHFININNLQLEKYIDNNKNNLNEIINDFFSINFKNNRNLFF